MPTSLEQLQRWLDEPEGTRLEFKEAKQRFDIELLLKYCVALANEGGGRMVLGVSDARPRQVVGTQALGEPGRTEAGLFERLGQRVAVEELHPPGGRVVIVHVPGRLPGTAWHVDGRYFQRAGDSLVPLSGDELRRMLNDGAADFTAQACPHASLSDLSSGSLALFKQRWARRSNDARKSAWSDEEALTNAELLADGQLTYAALILFGKPASVGRHLAQAELVFEYRSSDASGPAAFREEYREGFFGWLDRIWTAIQLRNERQSYQDGLFRVEVLTFDEISIREAILNAVAHRDYRSSASIFVRQFPQRLEVVSPGGFPPGITEANVLDQQNPRNRRLAEALGRCGLIERSGQGVNLMFEAAIRQGKPLPSFHGTGPHEVRLTLDGQVRNPAFVRFLERIGEQQLRSFSTHDFLALDAIDREKPLSEPLKARLPALEAAGAVERIGRGRGSRYVLSADLYASMGSPGTHTRKRGLDHETNKALLLKHLLKQGETGAPLSELRQVLPSLTEAGVQGLLNELRDSADVYLRGQRRWARWVHKACPPPKPEDG